MDSFNFNPFARSSRRRSRRRSSRSSSEKEEKEEKSIDILLISGHGVLIDEEQIVPPNSVYLHDVHCGFLSSGVKIEQTFFEKRIPDSSSYLSSWIMNTTNSKLGKEPVLVKRPNENYYDSSISFILDYRIIGKVPEHELIDECDRIAVQKSGTYSYNMIKSLEEEHDAKARTILSCAYTDRKGKMKLLPYDYELNTYRGALKKLAKKHPDAEPFFIITKDNVREIYESSIYPTVEDLELLFDEDDDYMRYTDFRESISMYDKTVSECLESYNNRIILIPSCRGNEEIDERRMTQMQDDSFGRLNLNKDTKYFSSSSSSNKRSTRKKNNKKKTSS